MATSAVKACGSGISSIDSRKPPRSAKANACRAPSGRTVSTEAAEAASARAGQRPQPEARRRAVLEQLKLDVADRAVAMIFASS